jgi:tetratricopeptide (TPR) repeat protein
MNRNIQTKGAKYVEGDDRSSNVTINSDRKKVVIMPHHAPYGIEKFVGRRDYVKEIIFALEHERPWLITLTGIGGVGKSSIAYYVGEKLKGTSSFEYIIWTSAKDAVLTSKGISEHSPEFTGLDSLLQKIVIETGLECREDFEQLSIEEKQAMAYEYMAMAPFLIIVDNLETITSEKDEKEISEFLSKLPMPSKALVTTRESKLEGEKVVNIKEMSDEEAKELLIQEAKLLNAKEILNLQDVPLTRLIESVGKIPLAITLLAALSAEKVSLGKIMDVLKGIEDKTKIIEFCFSEVYATLSEIDRKVFMALIVIEEDYHRTKPILIAVCRDPEHGDDEISRALLRLEKVSWIFEEPAAQSDSDPTYEMLPLTRIFGVGILNSNQTDANSLRERYAKELVRKKTYKELDRQYKKIYGRVGAKTEQEQTAVYLTQVGLVWSERGQYKKALEVIDQAITASPKFSYIHKVKADVLWKMGKTEEARTEYLAAKKFLPKKNDGLWQQITRQLIHVEKEVGNYDEMREYAKEFLEINFDRRILQMLAVSTSHDLHDFAAAETYFKDCFYKDPKTLSEIRHNVISSHARAVNLKRWAQVVKDPLEKHELVDRAIVLCEDAIKLDPSNMRCLELREECKQFKAVAPPSS